MEKPQMIRSVPLCRVIHSLLIMCFIVNAIILISLQLSTTVNTADSQDITQHSAHTKQHLMSDSTHEALKVNHQDIKVNSRSNQAGYTSGQRLSISRRLHQVADTEEELVSSETPADAFDHHEDSPFINWSPGVRTSWDKSRVEFHTSNISFPINEPHVCLDEPFLVIMVTSAVNNFEQRQTIRETWASAITKQPSRIVIIFLLGKSASHNMTLIKLVNGESQRQRDIVQTGVTDLYSNLAFKSVAMLKWMDTYCRTAKYLLKSDDDMYINIDILYRELQHSLQHKRFIMGEIIAGAQPIQDKTSKWYTPAELFPRPRYPKYVSGSAYVISGDLISDLYKANQSVDIFWLEDIYITGLCAKYVKATHVYNSKFGYKRRRLSPCLFQTIVTGHRLTTGEMRRMWNAVRNINCKNARLTIA